jgi:endonuclease/exonuclease/phosphatase family metal-dependent hydrolase
MTTSTRALYTTLLVATALANSVVAAGAQTTLVLGAPRIHVTDTMIQAGSAANTNFDKADILATDPGADYGPLRRSLIKFDTDSTMPAKADVQSAVMTLTIKAAGADAQRAISVFPVTMSFAEAETTWNLRRGGTLWASAGGDFGAEAFRQVVTNVAGAKVNFDVTALVQAAVSGATSSRYTRIALADLGASTPGSYREYHSSEALDPLVRPALTVVYGGTATTNPPAAPVAVPATMCGVALDKAAFTVGVGEANWTISVSTAADCAWRAVSDVEWLVVRSTTPASATGNGSVKVRAVTNTTSPSKRTGRVTINGAAYIVTQGGCGTSCTAPAPTAPPAVLPPPASAVTLRVLQYNTHHGGWGTDGVYNVERIVDWIVRANPDVVSLNEIEMNTGWSQGKDQSNIYLDLLQRKTSKTWYKVYFNRMGAATGIGQVILSTYPFVGTSGQLLSASRSAVDAMIAVNGRIINLVSTHLDNVTQANRLKEISEMLPWATTLAEQRIVAGDFNAWPETTEIANMKAAYEDTWLAAQTKRTAVGTGITHGSHRIDYIFKSKSATFLNLLSVQIFNTADAQGVRPSDHEPVLAVFEVR